jgi:hypothetical protein
MIFPIIMVMMSLLFVWFGQPVVRHRVRIRPRRGSERAHQWDLQY